MDRPEVSQDSHWSNGRCLLGQSWTRERTVDVMLRMRWLEPKDGIKGSSFYLHAYTTNSQKEFQSNIQKQYNSRFFTIELCSPKAPGRSCRRHHTHLQKHQHATYVYVYRIVCFCIALLKSIFKGTAAPAFVRKVSRNLYDFTSYLVSWFACAADIPNHHVDNINGHHISNILLLRTRWSALSGKPL